MSLSNEQIAQAMIVRLDDGLPEMPAFEPGIRRAPDRGFTLTEAQTVVALKNALRYVPEKFHAQLAPEFLEELRTRGRIYGYRFRPAGRLRGKPLDQYQGNCVEGKAFQVMIDNNPDFQVALYPYELVTYGETGQPCQNWLQYRLIKRYLEELTDEQTLVLESGHPSIEHIENVLHRLKSVPPPPQVETHLTVSEIPVADTSRYDRLRQEVSHA